MRGARGLTKRRKVEAAGKVLCDPDCSQGSKICPVHCFAKCKGDQKVIGPHISHDLQARILLSA